MRTLLTVALVLGLLTAARAEPEWVQEARKLGLMLCRGAVVPYFEFVSDRRWTDQEWRGAEPQMTAPSWLSSLTAPAGPER
ncbi:MAG: hypothetical protein AB1758_09445 [Candidatus Eremiobacterota bacterium]